MLLLSRPVEKIDVFICSNGGSSTVPWRLVALLREYTKNLGVLIPYRCYSAATLLALGANEIVMHPFAEMGPIDPTVSNAFNPVHPQTNQVLGIGVEDVKAYISFIKSTVGISHEDELVKTIEILAQKVHPLALGNVERFISQSRLVARKILLTHMSAETHEHAIEEIINNMASKTLFPRPSDQPKRSSRRTGIKCHRESVI
jgi:membrane-bound ClpP family serine protease